MSTEITNEEPVLVLNDKKYIISEMTDLQKAFVVPALASSFACNSPLCQAIATLLVQGSNCQLDANSELQLAAWSYHVLHSSSYLVLRCCPQRCSAALACKFSAPSGGDRLASFLRLQFWPAAGATGSRSLAGRACSAHRGRC